MSPSSRKQNMISFTVKPNGTITVKPKGSIEFCFKGKQMAPDRGTVVMCEENLLVVDRDSDNQMFNFVKQKSNWLLKGNDTPNSLLFGTRFVFDK